MKKLFLLMAAALFTGCSCLLSQVPPQVIYVDSNCEGRLPDYTKVVQASDNCGDVVLTQMPAPNTLLDVQNPAMVVTVVGTDRFGNKAQLLINVTLVDTVPPVLNWPVGQIAMGEQGVTNLYRNWVDAVKVYGIAHWIYDQRWTQGMAFADTARIMDNLQYFTHIIKLDSTEYRQYESYMNAK